jgi:LCP family protein required for cell wall assembly
MTEDDGAGTRSRWPGWAPRPALPPRSRRAVWIAGLLSAVLVLLTAGAGAWVFDHLNGNIRGMPLFGGAIGDAGREKPDAYGRTPINVLVIGSDARSDKADCAIGGDCGPGRNADVEMIVHLSADRTNATVMSVPRDTVTRLPGCQDPVHDTYQPPHSGQINASLESGPGCTVAAVHALTGIPIDHFMMIGFTGVVRMSDAVGGVPVCVTADVYDPYSHLRLAKGRHVLEGMSALQFLRSRHAFGDGSDIGRTYAQHLYLSALLRRLKSAGTLTSPPALYALADAATRALTVDTGLDSVPKLLHLARALDKVPAARVTFTTMQNQPDPSDPDRVVVAPAAKALFSAIIRDRSLTVPGGGRSATGRQLDRIATSPQALAARRARIALRAARHRRAAAGSPDDSDVSNDSNNEVIAGLAIDLPIPGGGDDAAFDAHQRTAAQPPGCAQVSPDPTILLNGRRLTPTQAYAATPNVPPSAR